MSTGTPTATLARPGKYLSFALGQEEYGVEILKVQEIVGLPPDYARGVINLRGHTLPVNDLRGRFNRARVEDTEKTCIIVIQTQREDATVTAGVIVDEISEVLNFAADQIEPSPPSQARPDVTGQGKLGKKAVILLDIDTLLTQEVPR